MSKKIIIGIVIFFLVIFLAVGVGVFFIFANLTKAKDSISVNEFQSIMESHSFTLLEDTSVYSANPGIEKNVIAKNLNYQIEFYDIIDEEKATLLYDHNRGIFESSRDDSNIYSSVSGKNYAKYTLTDGGKYKVISRIDDTFLYINADSDYKDEIKSILDELGY